MIICHNTPLLSTDPPLESSLAIAQHTLMSRHDTPHRRADPFWPSKNWEKGHIVKVAQIEIDTAP